MANPKIEENGLTPSSDHAVSVRRWTLLRTAVGIALAGMILAALLGASPSRAEEGGPFLGYELGYQSYQGDLKGSRGAVGLRGGYAAAPLSYELRAGYAGSRDYEFGGGVEFAFLRRGAFRPYASAGWGLYALVADIHSDTVRLQGNGPDIGLGLDYFVYERASVGLGLSERFVRYERSSDPRVRGGLDAHTTLLTLRWNVYY